MGSRRNKLYSNTEIINLVTRIIIKRHPIPRLLPRARVPGTSLLRHQPPKFPITRYGIMRRYFVSVEKVKAPSNVTRLRTTIVVHRVYYDGINDRHDWAIVEVGEEVLGHLGLGGDGFSSFLRVKGYDWPDFMPLGLVGQPGII